MISYWQLYTASFIGTVIYSRPYFIRCLFCGLTKKKEPGHFPTWFGKETYQYCVFYLCKAAEIALLWQSFYQASLNNFDCFLLAGWDHIAPALYTALCFPIFFCLYGQLTSLASPYLWYLPSLSCCPHCQHIVIRRIKTSFHRATPFCFLSYQSGIIWK